MTLEILGMEGRLDILPTGSFGFERRGRKQKNAVVQAIRYEIKRPVSESELKCVESSVIERFRTFISQYTVVSKRG